MVTIFSKKKQSIVLVDDEIYWCVLGNQAIWKFSGFRGFKPMNHVITAPPLKSSKHKAHERSDKVNGKYRFLTLTGSCRRFQACCPCQTCFWQALAVLHGACDVRGLGREDVHLEAAAPSDGETHLPTQKP